MLGFACGLRGRRVLCGLWVSCVVVGESKLVYKENPESSAGGVKLQVESDTAVATAESLVLLCNYAARSRGRGLESLLDAEPPVWRSGCDTGVHVAELMMMKCRFSPECYVTNIENEPISCP